MTLRDENSLNSLEQIKSNLERQIDSDKKKLEAIKYEIRDLSNYFNNSPQPTFIFQFWSILRYKKS